MDMKALTRRDETVVIVGFFDLMGYAKWGAGRPPRELLEMAIELFSRTGRAIGKAGGRLIKAIGDAGLFVFPAGDPDRAVLALMAMKGDCDAWLAESGYPDVMSVKVRIGPVACGMVGPPEAERLDVYGEAVNRAAMMRGRTFTVSAGLVDLLKTESRRNFESFDDYEFVAKGRILPGG